LISNPPIGRQLAKGVGNTIDALVPSGFIRFESESDFDRQQHEQSDSGPALTKRVLPQPR
jgi:hypothetical protein